MKPVTNFEKWINSIATGVAPDILPVTRFEHFLNRIRLAIARKGDIKSGLPDYTAEDGGKVLTIVPKMEKFTLIDEQSVYLDSHGETHLAENSYRLPDGVDVIGKHGHVIITAGSDTATLDGTFVDEGVIGLIAFAEVGGSNLEIAALFTGESAGDVYSSISSATVTISAYMDVESEAVEPAWYSYGLPAFTEADVGKSLSVAATPIIENVSIVARQSVTFDENGVSTVTIIDDWQEHDVTGGDEAILKVYVDGPASELSGWYSNQDFLMLAGTDPVSWTVFLSGANAGRITVAALAGLECEVEAWVIHDTGTEAVAPSWVESSGVLVVDSEYDNGAYVLNKTWQEIFDAPLAVVRQKSGRVGFYRYITTVEYNDWTAQYCVRTVSLDGVVQQVATIGVRDYVCANANGYPAYLENGGSAEELGGTL